MEKRLILAVALSILIIVSFQYFSAKVYPPETRNQKPENRDPRPSNLEPRTSTLDPRPSALEPSMPQEEETIVETERFRLVFSNLGGTIKAIGLKDFKSSDGKSPLELIKPSGPARCVFALDDPANKISPKTAYNLSREKNRIVYTAKTDSLEIIKEYKLHNSNNSIELQLKIKNKSDKSQELAYRITGGSDIVEPDIHAARFVEVASKVDGKVGKLKRSREARTTNPGIVSWTALKNKDFTIVLKPFTATKAVFCDDKNSGLLTGIEIEKSALPPLSFVEHKYLLYAGPADTKTLKSISPELEEVVDYGFFGGISKFLLGVLKFSYKVFHNWGVSIIVLSVLLNIVLFPLTNKSFKSMRKMQVIQPEMEKLKAQHKDNPQKMNKEVMELYKKHGVNPFSGCLPLLLQMPIFIALYQALSRSIDLKNASFLWIRDLSMPEAIKMPFTLPLVGNTINILPIFMAIAMVVQQKLSTASAGTYQTPEQKQQQQMMMVMMPIMFGFIFYNMPSGLVLYWFVNTMLTSAEQLLLLKSNK